MFKKLSVIIGILFCVGLGVLLHFTYEWSGYNMAVGYFSSVNESTWEHLKLLFFPVTLYTLGQFVFCERKTKGFLLFRAVSLLIGLIFITSAFFTVSGIVGKTDMPVVNIAIFVVGVIITFVLTELMLRSVYYVPKYSNLFALIIFAVFTLLFIVWSYDPPNIGLFKAP
ncbi:MAG: hypothetical protein IJ946_05365 [Clostridia bacterium]|nr:hypothetical protein [Clostridia bacterium]